jgi:hypothetical protein
MGVETALMIGGGMALGMMASKSFSGSTGGGMPVLEKPEKGVQAGLSEAENKRVEVMQRLERMRKATLLSKANMPLPAVRKTILGPAAG